MANTALDEIVTFQVNVARHWLQGADEVRGQPPFEFVALFAAFNALYWVWGLIDAQQAYTPEERESVREALKGRVSDTLAQRVLGGLGGMKNEAKLIDHLVAKLPASFAPSFMTEHAEFARHLVKRGAIARMDKRTPADSVGDPQSGDALLRKLSAQSSSPEIRVQAIAGILYLIRCNLVHGSKISDATDRDLLALSVPPLRSLALAALHATREYIA